MSTSSRLTLGVLVAAVIVVAAVASTPSSNAPSSAGVGVGGTAGGSSAPLAGSPGPSVAPAAPASAAHPAATAHPTARPLAHATATPQPAAKPAVKPAACSPTDQVRYVYNPYRLAVQASCIYVTGTVAAVRHEADGDLHILVALDPAYRHLLTAANQGEELGDLVIEPVCVEAVSQADAIATCAADRDPLMTLPAVGERVWMEGRYVFDTDHGGWAELHPLYRWGTR
ncbi:MAG: hypothetical protein ACYDCI_03260 [Candidatus Limnocylindrales bacterium]